MTQQIRLKVVSSTNQKVLFERYISKPLDSIPFATIIDAMEVLFDSQLHTTEFLVDTIKSIE